MHRSLLILTVFVLSAFGLAACADQAMNSPIAPSPSAAAATVDSTIPATMVVMATSMPTALPTAVSAATNTPTSSPTPTDIATAVSATSFPDPASYTWTPVASGLNAPVGFAHAGDDRIFILERSGRIQIFQAGSVQPVSFLDITDRVRGSGEQGLLGVAFHPQYASNGYFYVNYTDQNGNTHISRFSVRSDNPDLADPGTEKQILFIEQPFPNHNGGAMAFGSDHYLYIGLGDGGSGGDPLGNGQSLSTLLGKVLRIDIDQGDPYTIPAGNPFANNGGRPEIWAYGLRNPWRFAFDRLTGDLYIGDVGQNQYEEINFQSSGSLGGENYGWNVLEGTACYGSNQCQTDGTTPPVFTYSHAVGGCSVTGGVVYRGPAMPEWQGVYLFGDYCSGTVGGLLPAANWQQAWLFPGLGNISSFGEDAAGEVYLADLSGVIYQFVRK